METNQLGKSIVKASWIIAVGALIMCMVMWFAGKEYQ